MKRALLYLFLGILAVTIGWGMARGEQSAPAVKTILVGQNLRMVVIFAAADGVHFQYFTEPRAGEVPKPKGEEIFKDGQKISDSYREND